MNLLSKLRSCRIGPFAVFDFAASYTGAWYIAPYLKSYVSRKQVLYSVVPLAVVAHHLFSINTPLNRMVIGPDKNLLAQVIVVAMVAAAVFSKNKT